MFDWFFQDDSSGSESTPTTNEEWIAALEGSSPNPAALEQLRSVLVQGLRAALRTRVPEQADALAEDFAQDALVKILDALDTFRGESKFTTWAQKIAVRTALTDLRRKRWENVSLQAFVSEDETPNGPSRRFASEDHSDPADSTSQKLLLDRVRRIVAEELTERQRTAIRAVMQDMPLDEVARRMDTNRNALYKVIYDARTKIKDALDRQGLSADDLLAELN
jgi:RNA polymerase sigma-70 factor (ECF subfamily)